MSRDDDQPADADRIPPEEWRQPVQPPKRSGPLASRLARVRTGFLRYAVAGGAIVGAFAATIANGASERSEFGSVMIVGTTVGFAVGMVAGWASFLAVERRVIAVEQAPRLATIAGFGLALLWYVVAGLVAILTGALVGGMPAADLGQLFPGVFVLLGATGIVVLPVGAATGRSDRMRPATLGAAISQGSDDLLTNPSRTSRTFWGLAVGAVMFVVAFGLALIILLAVRNIGLMIAPGPWESFMQDFGVIFGVALVALWIVVGVWGWRVTMRLIDWWRRPAA
jgi:hypothetical protein